MRELETAATDGDEVAAEALEVFAYRVRKAISSHYCAVLGRVDALVFTGGIGSTALYAQADSRGTPAYGHAD